MPEKSPGCEGRQNQQPNCSEASRFYSKDSIVIATFGASTVAGTGAMGFQGFLKKHIEHCYSGKVVAIDNFAIPGETTFQGLLRIDEALRNRTGFFFILMGANDALRITEGTMKVSDTEASSIAIYVFKAAREKRVRKNANYEIAPRLVPGSEFFSRRTCGIISDDGFGPVHLFRPIRTIT